MAGQSDLTLLLSFTVIKKISTQKGVSHTAAVININLGGETEEQQQYLSVKYHPTQPH